MTERQTCLLFAAIYSAELLCAVKLMNDYSVIPILGAIAVLSFWINEKLTNPANAIGFKQIVDASAASLLVIVAGLVIIILNVHQWMLWLAVVMAYCIGNRLKSANIFDMSSQAK